MFASLQPKRAQSTGGTQDRQQNSKSTTNPSTLESSSPLSYEQRRRQSTEEAHHTDTDTDTDTDINTNRDVAAEDEEQQRSAVSQDSSSRA